VFIRASEVTKTFGADMALIDEVIREALPGWMASCITSVRFNLTMCYVLAQWFPLIDVIMPGVILNPEYRLHDMCLKSLRLARSVKTYESKWKPEKRLHRHYRRVIGEFETDKQGRVVSGPSYFPFEKIDLSSGPSGSHSSS
jgi:hypothetical protein